MPALPCGRGYRGANCQARADGTLVSIDSKSLFHEAKAAGIVYQAALRHELYAELEVEWSPVDPFTGMAEIADVTKAWLKRDRSALGVCANGHRMTSSSSTASPPRNSSLPRKKPPGQPNRNPNRRPNSQKTGALMRAV